MIPMTFDDRHDRIDDPWMPSRDPSEPRDGDFARPLQDPTKPLREPREPWDPEEPIEDEDEDEEDDDGIDPEEIENEGDPDDDDDEEDGEEEEDDPEVDQRSLDERSDEELRRLMVENYQDRWEAQRCVDACEDREQWRWAEYKKRIIRSMTPEEVQECEAFGVLESSEDAEAWWLDTFLVPVLKEYGVYDERYLGRELTDEEKEQLEAYESKVER